MLPVAVERGVIEKPIILVNRAFTNVAGIFRGCFYIGQVAQHLSIGSSIGTAYSASSQ